MSGVIAVDRKCECCGSSFVHYTRRPSLKRRFCDECTKKKKKEYADENRERAREYVRRYKIKMKKNPHYKVRKREYYMVTYCGVCDTVTRTKDGKCEICHNEKAQPMWANK